MPLDQLAHMGAAGQAEANRLAFTSTNAAGFNWRPYKSPPQVYQKSIANATKNVAHAAECPWDYAAWCPNGAGHPGPAWRDMNEYEPTWVKLNTTRLWIDKIKKDVHGNPIGWKE